jgi:hypothetical protein
MTELRVFLGGEGRNELGSWARETAYRNDEEIGVIKALLLRVKPQGWRVVGARAWKHCRKYTDFGFRPADVRRNIRSDNEKRAVLGLILDAIEQSIPADLVVFVRDQDDHPERAKVIADAIKVARTLWPHIRLVGDVAVPVLEAWILALMGERDTEALGKAKAQRSLAERGVTTTAEMVREVMAGRPVPEDAGHLNTWLAEAASALV